MRAVVQRVRRAEIRVGGERVSEMGAGLLALVAVGREDGAENARSLGAKFASFRTLKGR